MSKSITIVVAAAAFFLGPLAVHAAGLGRLTVLSPLGQPLLAEIEIVALQPGEEEGLTARLASADAFKEAGIEISPTLLGVRINLDRRDKRPVLRLTTTQPVNDPFLDLLVELSWSSGRLVREYSVLLDPPEFQNRPAIAAAPPPPPKPAPAEERPAATAPAEQPATPAPTAEAPVTTAPAPAPAQPEAAKPEAAAPEAPKPEAKPEPAKPAEPKTYEVKRGDTLGAIAKQNLPPGVTLNQMLVAIFRANEAAFIRGNVNLVRTGRILVIPDADSIGTLDRDEANRIVKEHHQQFAEYRSRLAAAPAPADAAGGQREAAGQIESKPAPVAPAAPSDQLRLSKVEPVKPGAPGSQAARADDAAARERALKEAESRQKDLEKNVADLQKLLELKNQQLAEAEKKAAQAAKPAPAPVVPPVAQAPAQPAPKAPEKPAAKAPEKPAAEPAKPAPPPPPPPVAQAPAPKPEAAKPEPAKPAPAQPKAEPKKEPAKPAAPVAKAKGKAAPKEWYEEYLEDPMLLGGLGVLVVLLAGYAAYAWRRKKAAHAKFQDSVLGAAAAGGGAAASLSEPTAPPKGAAATASQAPSTAPAGMEAEEVDPIAEADVYMAYGRDAQAEEILKEALQKDSSRTAVHAKLLEIYAHRKDPKAFEQTALKLKGLTNSAGPEWDKAAALGRSIDPGNGLYAGAGGGEAAAAAPAAPAAAAAPTLDFDLGGASQGQAPTPDISLDEPKEATGSGVDIELGTTQTIAQPAASPDETIAAPSADKTAGAMDFNLDLGAEEKKPAAPAAEKPAEASGGLDFDLNLDAGGDKKPEAAPAKPAAVDLSAISLDLGGAGDETVMAKSGGGDPKWQEVATKLDLAKAYEEMGDKDGARELLKEVVKDGDAAQRGSAEQLLAKLG